MLEIFAFCKPKRQKTNKKTTTTTTKLFSTVLEGGGGELARCPNIIVWDCIFRGGGGKAVIGSIFAKYVTLASQNPYSIIVGFAVNYRDHLSHLWASQKYDRSRLLNILTTSLNTVTAFSTTNVPEIPKMLVKLYLNTENHQLSCKELRHDTLSHLFDGLNCSLSSGKHKNTRTMT